MPATNGSFDIVVINGVLLILSSETEAEETFAEIARVLRSGGVAWVGEAVCRDNPANQKTYRGSSVIGYVRHAAARKGFKGARRALGEVTKTLITGTPIQLKTPQLITPEHWVLKAADRYGLDLMANEIHMGIDNAGHPQPSDSRRNFLFRKRA